MASLNPSIILSGAQPNLVGRVAQGMGMAQVRDEMQRENALADFYKQNGQGLVAGDPGAINALAAISPEKASAFQQTHLDNQRATEQHQMAMEEGRRQAAQWAQQVGDRERAASAERIKSGLAAASNAQTPEQWDALAQQYGAPELVGKFNERDAVIGFYTGQLAEIQDPKWERVGNRVVDMNNPLAGAQQVPGLVAEPADEYGRYAAEERAAGRQPLSRIDYAQAKKGNGVVMTTPDGTTLQVGGSGAPKFTEGQSKDNVYSTRARGALQNLEPVANALTSRGERAAGYVPLGIGRGMQSEDFQVAEQAGTEFLQAILRKDTGAAITQQEEDSYGRVYLPQPGDSEAVLEAKRQSRIRAVNALESGMSAAQMLARDRALIKSAQEASGQKDVSADNPYSSMTPEQLGGIDVMSLSAEQVDQLYEAMTR